jgi:p-aminobenzoyl-glutamate transporter AbgT
MTMKRLSWLIVIVLVLLPAGLALACPMCKDSIPNSDAQEAGSLPGGFNLSVYYMLVGLFVTIGLVTGVITKGVRSTNEQMNRHDENVIP